MFNELTLTFDILALFTEAQYYSRQGDSRTLRWICTQTEYRKEKAREREGRPEVLGSLAICKDGWAFKTLPPLPKKISTHPPKGGWPRVVNGIATCKDGWTFATTGAK